MSFQGYLMKFEKTGVEVPVKFIQTFKSTPNQRTDMDDYTDADGLFHRNELKHTPTKTEWTTPEMRIADWEELMALLKANYTITETESGKKRDVDITYYNFEDCDYVHGHFYIPDFTVEVHLSDRARNDLLLAPVRFAIIEY